MCVCMCTHMHMTLCASVSKVSIRCLILPPLCFLRQGVSLSLELTAGAADQ